MWTPPAVADRYRHERALLEQQIRDRAADLKGILDGWNRELRQIDARLEMIWLPDGCDTWGTPMKAGYYHVVRHNESAPPSVFAIEGPEGEFVEPTSRVFEMLARNDLWDPANVRNIRKLRSLAEAAAEKRKIAERAERQEEILERYKAGTRTFVSMDRSTPWSQNVAGRRGAKKEA